MMEITLERDGNMWCAMIGANLQETDLVGVGIRPQDALFELIKAMDAQESKNIIEKVGERVL